MIMLSLGAARKEEKEKTQNRREVPSRRRGKQREGNKREKQETTGRGGKGPTRPEKILHPYCLPLPAGPGERQPHCAFCSEGSWDLCTESSQGSLGCYVAKSTYSLRSA